MLFTAEIEGRLYRIRGWINRLCQPDTQTHFSPQSMSTLGSGASSFPYGPPTYAVRRTNSCGVHCSLPGTEIRSAAAYGRKR